MGLESGPGDAHARASGTSSAAGAFSRGATVRAHSPHPFEVGRVTITVADLPDVTSP